MMIETFGGGSGPEVFAQQVDLSVW